MGSRDAEAHGFAPALEDPEFGDGILRTRIPNTRFQTEYRRFRGVTGGTRFVCQVKLADDAAALSAEEQAAQLREFLIQRANRIASGKYEVAAVDGIWPLVNIGYAAIGTNEASCRVMLYMAFHTDGTFLT